MVIPYQNKLFRPAVSLMGRLNYSRRFALIGLLLLMAMSVVIYNLHQSLKQTINAANLELDGTLLIQPLSRTLQLVQQHRGLSSATLNGSEILTKQRIEIEKETITAFNKLQKALPEQITSSKDWAAINDEWSLIRKEGLNWDVRENFDHHTKLALQLLNLGSHIADDYALSTDPQLDSHYLINAMTSTLPQTLEHLGQVRAYGLGILLKKQISESQKNQLNVLIGEFTSTVDNFNMVLDKTAYYNPSLAKLLSSNTSDFSTAAQDLLYQINSDILNGVFESSAEGYFIKSTATIDAGYKQIYQTLIPELQRLLKTRVQRAEWILYFSTGIALLLFFLVIYFAIAIHLVTRKSLLKLDKSANILATGDLQERVQLDTHDELALVGDSFNKMADGFQKLHDALLYSEQRLAFALEGTSTGVWDWELETDKVFRSAQWHKIYGYTEDDILPTAEAGRKLIHPEDLLRFKDDAHAFFEGETRTLASEFRLLCKDNSWKWTLSRGMVTDFTPEGKPRRLIGTHTDITERKQAEQTMQLATLVFENSSEGMMVTDADSKIITVNNALSRLSGYTQEALIGNNPNILKSKRQDTAFYEAMWQSLITSGKWHGEIWNLDKNGKDFAVKVTINTVFDKAGNALKRVAIYSDISEQHKSAEMIWHQANFDRLTDLPNRALFIDHLSKEISQARRYGQYIALLFLDLDGFKGVNDTYGHEAGDLVLKTVAKRWLACMREGDTVARIGGDEFTVVACALDSPEQAAHIAEKLIQALTENISLSNACECSVGVSVGIGIYPNNGKEMDSLLAAADNAMYESKARGKNTYTYSNSIIEKTNITEVILDDAHLVGISEIDDQHLQLVRLLNELIWAVTNQHSIEQVQFLFDEIVKCTVAHFEYEHRLMRQYKYPKMAEHDMEHSNLIKTVLGFSPSLYQGDASMTLQAVKDWVLMHILHSDKSLGKFLAEKGLANTQVL